MKKEKQISYQNHKYKGSDRLGGQWEVTRMENGRIISQKKVRKEQS